LIQAVIFDIDGTLVDSVDLHARAWQDAFRHFGRDIPYDQIRSQIGKGGDQLKPVFLTLQELDQFGKALDEYRSERFEQEYFDQVRAFPRVRDLFERIKGDGKRIALATSARPEELKRLKQIAQISDLVETETSSGDVEKSKPHPDVFEAAMAGLGDLDPADVLVVGDSPYDAEAAGKAGLRTIGVLCGGFAPDDLRQGGCIALYADPADLLAHYDQSPIHRG
jgi:HAD superfamily hydrolase (TIGR01549 family)